MTEARSTLERALDLLVYAPLGLAVTIVEELPDLADKGRARLAQRTSTARVVGQFAVAQGRSRLRSTGPTARPSRPTPPAPPARPAPLRSDLAADAAAGGARTVSGSAGARAGVPRGRSVSGRPDPAAKRAAVSSTPDLTVVGGRASTAPLSGELAIPGYDSLSASQVVQRLASLSPDELEAVRAYEAGARGRRTILARVVQLQRG